MLKEHVLQYCNDDYARISEYAEKFRTGVGQNKRNTSKNQQNLF